MACDCFMIRWRVIWASLRWSVWDYTFHRSDYWALPDYYIVRLFWNSEPFCFEKRNTSSGRGKHCHARLMGFLHSQYVELFVRGRTTSSASTIWSKWSSRPPAAVSPSSSWSCNTCREYLKPLLSLRTLTHWLRYRRNPELNWSTKTRTVDGKEIITVFFIGIEIRYAMMLWVAAAIFRFLSRASITASTSSALFAGARCAWNVPVRASWSERKNVI